MPIPVPPPKKRGAKIAKWLADKKMREEEALIAEAMLRATAPGTPRLLPPPPFEASGAPLPHVPRSLEIGNPQSTIAESNDSYSAMPGDSGGARGGRHEKLKKRYEQMAASVPRNGNMVTSQGEAGLKIDFVPTSELGDTLLTDRETAWAANEIFPNAIMNVGGGATANLGRLGTAKQPIFRRLMPNGSGVRFDERAGDLVIVSFEGEKGLAEATAVLIKQGDTLILRRAHIQGAAAFKETKEAAKIYAKERGFSRVIIEPGERTTGLTKGRTPRPIIIETGLKSR